MLPTPVFLGFPCGSAGEELACNAEYLGLIPGLGRYTGEGNSYPLQYSGLEDSVDCLNHGGGGCKELDKTEQLSLSNSSNCTLQINEILYNNYISTKQFF